MPIQQGTLNNHPIIENSAATGVPVTDQFGNGIPDLVAANASVLAKSGLTQTHSRPPTVDDDGFSVPSFWVDETFDHAYMCVDNSSGAAVWKGMSSATIVGSPGKHEDITAELQAAIDGYYNLPILITGGRKYITESIRFPRKTGHGVIQGIGSSEFIAPDNSLIGQHTLIEWSGSYGTGEPMFNVEGSHIVFRDMTINGAHKDVLDTASKADIGILVQKPQGGIGVGKVQLENISLNTTNVGVQFSVEPTESNCDVSCGVNTHFRNCETDFLFMQAFNIFFNFYHHSSLYSGAYSTHKVFDFSGGGNCQVYGINLVGSGLILSLGTDGNELGSNNCSYMIDGLKCDEQGSGTQLVDCVGNQLAQVTFSNGHLSYDDYFDDDVRIANMKGPMRLNLQKMFGIPKGAITFIESPTGRVGQPYIKIEDCISSSQVASGIDFVHLPESSGNATIRVRDCQARPAAAIVADLVSDSITGTLSG